MQFSRMLARWFPVPQLIAPRAAGIDITDTAIKWLSFQEDREGLRVASWGTETLGSGIVERGVVKDATALGAALQNLRKKQGIRAAHAALPEEGAYIFSMHVPARSGRREIASMIEFELEARVPIPVSQAVYDFDTVDAHDERGEEIAVSVFPIELAEGYAQAFGLSGIELLSLELEARSVGRATAAPGEGTTLLVDCGYARTGVAILKNGVPLFTSTLDIGGLHLSKAVMDTLSVSEDEARTFKNERGIVGAPDDKARLALEKAVHDIGSEIVKHSRFWETRRTEHGGQLEPVLRVHLLGGSANLKGFPEYIASMVHVPTERPNAWRNAFSFDDVIPPIERRVSLQYATAIGLALRSVS